MSWNSGLPSPPPLPKKYVRDTRNDTDMNVVTPPQKIAAAAVRSFGIDPKSFHVYGADSSARSIRYDDNDNDGDDDDDANNFKAASSSNTRKRGSSSVQQWNKVTTPTAYHNYDGDNFDGNCNSDGRRRPRKRQLPHQSVTPPYFLEKLSRTLNEARSRSKRIVSRLNFDVYRRETQYEEYPLQIFALDHLDALLRNRGTTMKEETDIHPSASTIGINKRNKKNNSNIDIDIDNAITTNDPHRKYSSTTTNRIAKINESNNILLPASPLWSMEPRIFAVEKAGGGKRRYITAHLGRFMHHYWRECDPSARHHYELIRQGDPCRLYFGRLRFWVYGGRYMGYWICLRVCIFVVYIIIACFFYSEGSVLPFHSVPYPTFSRLSQNPHCAPTKQI